jgi:hypothetical protein
MNDDRPYISLKVDTHSRIMYHVLQYANSSRCAERQTSSYDEDRSWEKPILLNPEQFQRHLLDRQNQYLDARRETPNTIRHKANP